MTEEERRREALRRKRARERVVPEEEMQPKHRKSNQRHAARNKKRRMKKKPKNTFLHVIFGMFATAIIVAVFLVLFQTKEVQVTGNEYTSREAVVSWLQSDQLSSNSFYVWVRGKMGKPEPLPTASSMKVKLKAPWKVLVVVNEKPVVAGVNADDEYIYFDEDGIVMTKESSEIADVPIIEGIDVTDAVLYKKLTVEDETGFNNLLSVSQMLIKYELVPDKVECTSDGEVNVTFGKVLVTLGTGNYEVKISQISPILDQLDNEAGTLELQSYDGTQSSISFQKKSKNKTKNDTKSTQTVSNE